MLEDLDFYQRYQRFHSVFEDLRKGIPEKEIEEIVAGIILFCNNIMLPTTKLVKF